MNLVLRYAKPVFWAALLFAYVAAIMPAKEAPQIADNDKVQHMIAFFTLAVLGRLAYVSKPVWLTWVLLAAFGALIEFTQMIPFIHRDAELNDWIADVVALSVGLGVVALVLRFWGPGRERPGT